MASSVIAGLAISRNKNQRSMLVLLIGVMLDWPGVMVDFYAKEVWM